MGSAISSGRSALMPAATSLEAELNRIAAMNKDELRLLWRQKRKQDPPAAFSKDLLARALSYWLQEQCLGELSPALRRQLAAIQRKPDSEPLRHVKVGSVIVREHQGTVHEVMVLSDGFCWQGQIYASLSTIARKITGTSWNGPRFFGLRGKEKELAQTGISATREKAVGLLPGTAYATSLPEPKLSGPRRSSRGPTCKAASNKQKGNGNRSLEPAARTGICH